MSATCSRCQIIKNDDNCTKKNNGRYQAYCKNCTKLVNSNYYQKNHDSHCQYVCDTRRKVHTCKHCGKSEPDVSFYRRKDTLAGSLRFICTDCDKVYRKQFSRQLTSADARKRATRNSNYKDSLRRKDPAYNAKYTLRSAQYSDKKRGHNTDLTLEDVAELIKEPCRYCGTNSRRISLDRIDNNIGHLKCNVNPSCLRCNWLRRDMPYNVWIKFVPLLSEIEADGLLDTWHAGPNKHLNYSILIGSVPESG